MQSDEHASGKWITRRQMIQAASIGGAGILLGVTIAYALS